MMVTWLSREEIERMGDRLKRRALALKIPNFRGVHGSAWVGFKF